MLIQALIHSFHKLACPLTKGYLYQLETMIRNYFKIALRNLVRHKGYAAINILGLTLSIASATLLYLYINHEQSFDSFHEKSERTYRLIEMDETDGEVRHLATTAPPVGQAMVDEYPSVLYSTRMFSDRGHLD